MSATAAQKPDVVYACGCKGTAVGQSFSHGIMICPVHSEPLAPYDKPEPPARHTLTIEIELESPTYASAISFQNWIERIIFHDGRVRAMTVMLADAVKIDAKVGARGR